MTATALRSPLRWRGASPGPSPTLALFVRERCNERAVWCENLHMAAPDIQDSDDDLAELLPDGEWHVTTCEHCGAAVEHTSINPAFIEIAQALHAFGHCT